MATKNQTRTNELKLAEEASSRIAQEMKERDPDVCEPGELLPDSFVNPEIGTRGHKCVDGRGRYQPSWYALKIHKTSENLPQRQYFNCNGKGWYVEVGTWADVPPEILSVLQYTEQQIISMDVDKAGFMSERGVPRVVDVVPRFSYTSFASA